MTNITLSVVYIIFAIALNGCTDTFVLPQGKETLSSQPSSNDDNTDTEVDEDPLPEESSSPSMSGFLDSSFGIEGIIESSLVAPLGSTVQRGDFASDIMELEDGRILVLGRYTAIDAQGFVSEQNIVLMRHNPNGSLDNTFGNNGITSTNINTGRIDLANCFALQPNGKIIVAGDTANEDNEREFLLLRYNSDGSLDNTFGDNGVVTTTIINGNHHMFNDVEIQSDGKIVAVGNITGVDNIPFPAILRYNSDGSLDNTFGDNGVVFHQDLESNANYESVAIHTNGKIIASGYARDMLLVQYNIDGSLDNTFAEGGMKIFTLTPGVSASIERALDIETLPGGKTIITGVTELNPGNRVMALMKLQANGNFDNNFGLGGFTTTDVNPLVDDIPLKSVLQTDGKILIAGFSGVFAFNGSTSIAVLRYNPNGTLDTSFAKDGMILLKKTNGLDIARGLALQKDGRILIAGASNPFQNVLQWIVARFFP